MCNIFATYRSLQNSPIWGVLLFKKMLKEVIFCEGNFSCACNELTSLSGAPQKVGGNFDCSWNRFVSLQGAPKQVGGDFKCLDCCSLKSSKGAPRLLGGIFICHDRQFESKPVYENGKLKNSAVVKITSPLSHVR